VSARAKPHQDQPQDQPDHRGRSRGDEQPPPHVAGLAVTKSMSDHWRSLYLAATGFQTLTNACLAAVACAEDWSAAWKSAL